MRLIRQKQTSVGVVNVFVTNDDLLIKPGEERQYVAKLGELTGEVKNTSEDAINDIILMVKETH